MCTHNGAAFLDAQLASFNSQTISNWELWVSDDLSTDTTIARIEDFKKESKRPVFLTNGPCKGFAQNFMSLVFNINTDAEYYAFSDQDDIWENSKLETAISYLKKIPKNTPALYCSTTTLIDSHNAYLGMSAKFLKPPSFKNALIQNIASGNTMVMNKAGWEKLHSLKSIDGIVAHDWLAYLVITGCGGEVIYDKIPTVRYRQHKKNLIGQKSAILTTLIRFKVIINNEFKKMSDRTINLLLNNKHVLTDENLRILLTYSKARQQNFLMRLFLVFKSGVYRQTILGSLGFALASVLNKI